MYPDEDDVPHALHELLDHTQDKIVVVDEQGVYRLANDAVERMLGYTPEAFVGRNVFEDVHPEDRDGVRSAFESLVAASGTVVEDIEYRYEAADGSWVWLESRLSNEMVAELNGYVVSSRDVTDRKRAEQRERETESRLSALAANSEDVLWMFDVDWEEALFINRAYEDIWGLPIDDLRADGTAFIDGIHPDDRPEVRAAMERLSAGEAVDIEYRVNPGLEYRRWVWVKAQPIVEDGEVTRIAGFARDITNRRRHERQLRVMDTLLRHNLRNDMNVILGHAEQCHRDGPAEGVREHMAVILETGRELLETAEKEREIVDLLVDIGGPEPLDLQAVVSRLAAATREDHTTATVDVEVASGRSPAGAAGDEGSGDHDRSPYEVSALPEIERALGELLENAIDHAEVDPEISIELAAHDGVVELVLRDNAPPIPGNEYEPLLGDVEPSTVYHGTGLGLWLVFWIVDLSEGDIEFDRGPAGNVITIRLPAADG